MVASSRPRTTRPTTTPGGYLASPDVGVVTLTVTEAGYLRDADGSLDRTTRWWAPTSPRCAPTAPPRRTAPAGWSPGSRRGAPAEARSPLVPCDNLPGNGAP